MQCLENTVKLSKKTDGTRIPQPLTDTILSLWAVVLIVVFVFKIAVPLSVGIETLWSTGLPLVNSY